MLKGIVAIVGRPNVGKSTLFNRLTGKRTAIVDDRPGVTRDRLYGDVFYDQNLDKGFTLVDTGGFEAGAGEFQPFAENLVWKQTQAAINAADLIVFLLDGQGSPHGDDRVVLQYIRSQNKPIIPVVNKIDGVEKSQFAMAYYELGLQEEMMTISAAYNRGITDLLRNIRTQLGAMKLTGSTANESDGTKIALIGRPNVGKSSILNRLTGEDRSLVSDIAGTTRDSVNSKISYNKKPYTIVDTAGLRRKSRINEKLEGLCAMRSLRAIEQADIAVLVIDACEGLTDQDARLAHLAAARGKPMVLVVNKWDLYPNKETNSIRDYTNTIREVGLKNLAYIPILFISCAENQRVHNIMATVESVAETSIKRADTASVNRALQQIIETHSPQLIRAHGKRMKFFFATQVEISPPTIVVKCNVADEIQESYKRFMIHQFREILGFDNVPVRLIFRGKEPRRLTGENEEASANDLSPSAVPASATLEPRAIESRRKFTSDDNSREFKRGRRIFDQRSASQTGEKSKSGDRRTNSRPLAAASKGPALKGAHKSSIKRPGKDGVDIATLVASPKFQKRNPKLSKKLARDLNRAIRGAEGNKKAAARREAERLAAEAKENGPRTPGQRKGKTQRAQTKSQGRKKGPFAGNNSAGDKKTSRKPR